MSVVVRNPAVKGLKRAITLKFSAITKTDAAATAKASAATVFEVEASAELLMMRSEFFKVLLENNDETQDVLELDEVDPKAAANLIVKLHGFEGYGDAFNAADAKLSTKWICSDFIAKINEIINKILVEAYKKALVPRKKGEDLAQMFLEDVNSFPQIANVVAEHTAYQGPIEISFESNPPPQQQEQNGNYNHYNVNNNPSNYHYNAMGLPQDPKPTEIINVKKKAFISFITFLGFPAESINYGLSSEELRDLLLLQKKYANQ